MLDLLALLFPLIFTNNLIMSIVKWLSGAATSVVWLRAMLAVVSILGIIASSAITGDAVNFNQITDIAKMLVEALTIGVASHFSYRIIKEA